MQIIDRRLNQGNKSLENRQRFLRRAKAHVQRAVREATAGRDIPESSKAARSASPRAASTSRSSGRAPAASATR
jgi:Uncharacterized conserved protein